MIGKLYGIDREHKEYSDRERWQARQQNSLTVLEELECGDFKNAAVGDAKSALGIAQTYMPDYRDMLKQTLRICDSPAGVTASAVTHSLLQTFKAMAGSL